MEIQNAIKYRLKQADKNICALIERHPLVTCKDQLTKLEKKTKYSRAWFLTAAVTSIFLTLLGIGGWQLISKLICFVYPALQSFKAIDTPTPRAGEMWLSYWVILAAFTVTEPVLYPLLRRIPLYPLLKVLFIMWCYNPNTKGAATVYNTVMKPLVLPYIGGAAPPRRSRQMSAGTAAAVAAGAGSSSNSAGNSSAAVVEPDVDFEHVRSAEPVLVVKVISASGLPIMEGDSPDAYVLLCVKDGDGSLLSNKSKTKLKPKTQEPKWGEEVRLPVKGASPALSTTTSSSNHSLLPAAAALTATVMHKTGFGSDLPIGTVTLPLSAIAGSEELDSIYPLQPVSDGDSSTTDSSGAGADDSSGVGHLRLAVQLL